MTEARSEPAEPSRKKARLIDALLMPIPNGMDYGLVLLWSRGSKDKDLYYSRTVNHWLLFD